jgi:hypothetical protein
VEVGLKAGLEVGLEEARLGRGVGSAGEGGQKGEGGRTKMIKFGMNLTVVRYECVSFGFCLIFLN